MNKRISACVVLLLSISWIEAATAGIYDSAARRAASGALKKIKPVTPPVIKESLTVAERAKYAEILAKLDRDVLARIESRFGEFIGTKRMDAARGTPTAFLDQKAYQQSLRKEYPDLSNEEIESIIGHYSLETKRLYVNQNTIVVPNVAAHERLHQLSSPRFEKLLGRDMNEGATGYFSRQVYGDLALVETRSLNYPEFRRLIDLMGSRVGDKAIAKAYFQGDFRLLSEGLDRQLGEGAFSELSGLMRRGEYKSAESILIRPLQ